MFNYNILYSYYYIILIYIIIYYFYYYILLLLLSFIFNCIFTFYFLGLDWVTIGLRLGYDWVNLGYDWVNLGYLI
jgi:hypothetical protein